MSRTERKSKGLTSGWTEMRERVVPALYAATGGGALRVVVDATSCTEGLIKLLAAEERFTVVDAVEFVDSDVRPLLPPAGASRPWSFTRRAPRPSSGSTPPCCAWPPRPPNRSSSPRRGAAAPSPATGACFIPELTASVAHASVNRACELGMTRATGRPYRHVLEILEHVTRP